MTVVDLLSQMVQTDSVNGELSGRDYPESSLVGYLESVARQHGLDAQRVPPGSPSPNLLVSCEKDPSFPWLLFDSHLDTVSVEDMDIDPFGGGIRDGRLWGRGACDTKGSGAAMFAALREYSEQPCGKNNVMVLYSVGEEVGMTGVRELAESETLRTRRIMGAVVGEPTSLQMVVAHNGVERHMISVEGVAAHSSNPDAGISAIRYMAELVQHLERRYIRCLSASHPLTGQARCSINTIHGGSAINIIPDHCEIEMDRRTVPGETHEAVAAQLESCLDSFRRAHTAVAVTSRPLTQTPCLESSGDDGFSRSVSRIISGHDRNGTGVGVGFATHAGVLQTYGIESIVLGPGSVEQAHTRDEWIDILELEAAVPIYLEIMRNC